MTTNANPPRESLDAMLRIEAHGPGAYTASLESFWGSTQRGDALARMALAVMQESGTVPTSLHASFLTKASPEPQVSIRCAEPLGVQRRAQLFQGENLVCDAVFRCDPPAGSFAYQRVSCDPNLPSPETLPSEAEQGAREGWAEYAVGPVESRRVTPRAAVTAAEVAVWTGWLAPRQPLRADRSAQTAALVFLAEYRSHWAVERCLGAEFRTTRLSLNDFALWIHRPAEWNDFWLVTTRTDVAAGGRCLSRREIYTRQGELVATAAWELSARRQSE